MPNISNPLERIEPNGYYHRNSDLEEERINSNRLQKNQPKSNGSLELSWSSLTQELIDTLPRVGTRGLLYFLILFAVLALPWAILFKVDVTGTARGRLEPKEKTFKLDAPVAETVTEIQVKEGEQVKAGQILLKLESKSINAQLQQQQLKFVGQQNRLHQLKLLKNQLMLSLRTQEQQNQAQLLEKQAQVEEALKHLESLKALYGLQKKEQQFIVEQVLQAVDSSKIAYELAEIQLKGAQEKSKRYQKAFEEGVISQDRFQEVKQLAQENQERLLQANSDISQARAHLKEKQSIHQKTIKQALADIQQAKIRLSQQQNNYESLVNSAKIALIKSEEQLKNLETEIATLSVDTAQSKTEMSSLQFQLKQRVIKAPVEGTVFELPIQRAGAVVQPGNMMVEIAPAGSSLILRAQIGTTESGSLDEGMPVKIKFDGKDSGLS